jgi:hypothetical protein
MLDSHSLFLLLFVISITMSIFPLEEQLILATATTSLSQKIVPLGISVLTHKVHVNRYHTREQQTNDTTNDSKFPNCLGALFGLAVYFFLPQLPNQLLEKKKKNSEYRDSPFKKSHSLDQKKKNSG